MQCSWFRIFSAWAFHGLPRHALTAQPHVSPATGTRPDTGVMGHLKHQMPQLLMSQQCLPMEH